VNEDEKLEIEDRLRIEVLLDEPAAAAADHVPFTEDDVAAVEAALGRPAPPLVKFLWRRFGEGELPAAYFYSPNLVVDLLGQYAEVGLTGLLPIAGDRGSCDYAIDPDGAFDLWKGVVFNVSASARSPDFMHVATGDLVGLVAAAIEDKLPDPGFRLSEIWTTKHRDAAYDDLPASLRGLGRADFEIDELYFRTSTPKVLLPLRDLAIEGIPCQAPDASTPAHHRSLFEVHLNRGGRVWAARLARDHVAGDFPCRAGTKLVFKEDGSLDRFTPGANVTFRGLLFKAGEEIETHELYYGGVLVEPAILDGIPCAAARVRLELNGHLLEATLSAAHVVDGHALPAGAWFDRALGGDLYRICLPGGEKFQPGTIGKT